MKKLVCAVLSVYLLFACAAIGFAVPGPAMEITRENVLAVMDAYDPADAAILRDALDRDDDFLQWFSDGGSFLDEIGTCVHETFHGYCHRASSAPCRDFYWGDGETRRVYLTEIFSSEKMAGTIPQKYRTLRFDTYITPGDEPIGSNISGIYGLMDEFNAYCRGMCAGVALFNCLKDQNASPEEWRQWVVDCESNQLAFAEFRYYILCYLTYAKGEYPQVYDGIVKNSDFIAAYSAVEKEFAEKIDLYNARLEALCAALEEQGYRVRKDDRWFYVGNRGIGRYVSDYNMLTVACLDLEDAANALRSGGAALLEAGDEQTYGEDGARCPGVGPQLIDRWKELKKLAVRRLEQLKRLGKEVIEKLQNALPQIWEIAEKLLTFVREKLEAAWR